MNLAPGDIPGTWSPAVPSAAEPGIGGLTVGAAAVMAGLAGIGEFSVVPWLVIPGGLLFAVLVFDALREVRSALRTPLETSSEQVVITPPTTGSRVRRLAIVGAGWTVSAMLGVDLGLLAGLALAFGAYELLVASGLRLVERRRGVRLLINTARRSAGHRGVAATRYLAVRTDHEARP